MRKWFIQTAALSVSLSLVADAPPVNDPFEQGYAVSPTQLPAIYNHTARYDVCGTWDFFLGGSFIYWYASQDGMDVAVSVDSTFLQPFDGTLFVQEFKYAPGFKVTAGWNSNYDDWCAYAEYTWYRVSSSFSAIAPANQTLLFQTWEFFGFFANDFGPNISSRWRLGVDLLDANLSRPFYQGTKLTVTPYFGLRTAWIRQTFRLAQRVSATNAPNNPVISHIHSYCWGIGPRGGLSCNWLLKSGFRVLGDASASLLFTRYTKISARMDQADVGTSPIFVRTRDYDTLRPNATGVLGVGYGSYSPRQRYHFDLAASYEFTVFWLQNMMRQLTDTYNGGAGASAGDLFVHGWTISTQLDF